MAPREILASARGEPPWWWRARCSPRPGRSCLCSRDAGWTVNDEFSRGTIYDDSFGARKILVWLGTGDLLDRGRLPLITILAGVGLVFAVIQARRREPPRVLIGLGLVSMVLFFGRPTLGFVIDLLPGGGDLFLRRFINGVHLAALYLAGLGLMFLVNLLMALLRRWKLSPKPVIAIALVVAAAAGHPRRDRAGALRTPGWPMDRRTGPVRSDRRRRLRGARWSDPATWVRTGSSPSSAAPASRDTGSGRCRPSRRLLTSRPTRSGSPDPLVPPSPAEYRFAIGDPDMRDLFGVRYVIWPEDRQLPAAQRVAQVGRHVLWGVPRYRLPRRGRHDRAGGRGPGEHRPADVIDPAVGVVRASLRAHRGVRRTGRPLRRPSVPTNSPRKASGHGRERNGPSCRRARSAGSVEMDRPGVVLFKVSYDPRWAATVDGEPGRSTDARSPALVGVSVAGKATTRSRSRYQAVPAPPDPSCSSGSAPITGPVVRRACRRSKALVYPRTSYPIRGRRKSPLRPLSRKSARDVLSPSAPAADTPAMVFGPRNPPSFRSGRFEKERMCIGNLVGGRHPSQSSRSWG